MDALVQNQRLLMETKSMLVKPLPEQRIEEIEIDDKLIESSDQSKIIEYLKTQLNLTMDQDN